MTVVPLAGDASRIELGRLRLSEFLVVLLAIVDARPMGSPKARFSVCDQLERRDFSWSRGSGQGELALR